MFKIVDNVSKTYTFWFFYRTLISTVTTFTMETTVTTIPTVTTVTTVTTFTIGTTVTTETTVTTVTTFTNCHEYSVSRLAALHVFTCMFFIKKIFLKVEYFLSSYFYSFCS